MKDILRYKGFIGSIEISIEDDCLHGKLLFINDLVTYEARTPNQLQAEFESAVEDYLTTCKELGRSPDKPFKGTFNIRVGSELHQKLAKQAALKHASINDIVKQALIECLGKSESPSAG
ncbi:MAG: type II toxin-antitoxin system HicB family antitoxin [Syntrophobacteraceae bacterium]